MRVGIRTIEKKKITLFITLLLANASVSRPSLADTQEQLQKKIFGEQSSQRVCKVVTRGLKGETQKIDKDLHQTIHAILNDHSKMDAESLQTKFHSRLRHSAGTLRRVFKTLSLTYGKPVNFTIYRIWAMNTVDGSPDVVACHDDQLAIGPHYGYPVQFGMWIQVMGKNELGRIYASLVPVKGKGWRIGAWHLQQWTHKSKDPQAWVDEALDDFEKGDAIVAFTKLDIAQKLLDGGGYVYPVFLEDVKVTKASYIKDSDFLKHVADKLSNYKVVYAGSIFARDGAGILVRFEVPLGSKMEKVKGQCEEAAKQLYTHIRSGSFGGLKCSFVVPGEDPKKDGHIGTRFLSRNEIGKLEKKSKK